MALDFTVKDVIHKVMARFVPAFLPNAKKAYNLRAVYQPELDIHEVASKAAVYNIQTDPKVIEEGFNAACQLILYLAADGFKIRTLLFILGLGTPGEYDGSESALAQGIHAEARLQATKFLREYFREHVLFEFIGFDSNTGLIARAVDESDGQVDTTMTGGQILTVRGYGFKIEADETHEDEAGLFFVPVDGGDAVKAEAVAVNEPKTLKVVVPEGMTQTKSYRLKIVTQSPVKGGGTLFKEPREMVSDFTLKFFRRSAPSGSPSQGNGGLSPSGEGNLSRKRARAQPHWITGVISIGSGVQRRVHRLRRLRQWRHKLKSV